MTDETAILIGYAVMWLGSGCIVTLLLAGCAFLCNWAVWHIVHSYGGIKVLNEFREWHGEHKRTASKAADSAAEK